MPFFGFDSWNLLSAFLLIAAVQAFLFGFAAAFKTDKLTDLAYGFTFALVAVALLVTGPQQSTRTQLVAIAVLIWGVRLGAYLFARILKMGQDRRFDGRRETVLDFAPFWGFQTVTIWVVLLPLLLLSGMREQPPLGPLDLAGFALWVIGFLIETFADQQKFAFRNNPENSGRWIQSGFWKYSRYPNYFGEILLWWGLWVAALPALSGWLYLSVIGPAFITFILVKISGIPLLEKEHERKYGTDPAFQAYVRQTSLLFPWAPRRDAD